MARVYAGVTFSQNIVRGLVDVSKPEKCTLSSKARHLQNGVNAKPFVRRPSHRAVILRLVRPTSSRSMNSEKSNTVELRVFESTPIDMTQASAIDELPILAE